MVSSASPGWSDGYWHCVGDPGGEVNLISALRLYHNTNVIDAYVIVATVDGKQYNVRATRRLRPDIDDLTVGPFSMDIIRGHRTLKLGLESNPHQVEFDILWESAAPPYDEASGVRRWVDGRLMGERSNIIQLGNLSGYLKVGPREYNFKVEDGWVGAKDHSWGLGDTGWGEKPHPHAAPGQGRPRSFWGEPGARHWSLIRFPDRSLYYSFRHHNDGSHVASGTGANEEGTVHSWIDYPYDSGKEGWAYTDVKVVDAQFEDGWPRMKAAEIHFTRPDGGLDRFQVDIISEPVYMQGGGYWGGWNDGLGRGIFRGEDVLEGEIWDVSHPVKVFDESGKTEVPQRPGGHFAELYGSVTNLDDSSDVGLGLIEIVFSQEYQGIKAV